jgi:WD40 repeat protein
VWEWPSGRLLRRIALGINVGRVAFTPDGRRLGVAASAFGEGLTRFWDVETGQALPPPDGHSASVCAVGFAGDGTVRSAGADGTVRVWDATTGRTLRQFSMAGPSWTGRVVAMSAGGRAVVTGNSQSPAFAPARIWDTTTGRESHAVGPRGVSVTRAALTADGRLLATSYPRNHLLPFGPEPDDVRLWDVASGRFVRQLDGPQSGALAFAPDGRFLAAGGGKGVRTWDTATGRPVWAMEEEAVGLTFAPDGRALACVGRNAVTVYELASGQVRLRIATPPAGFSGDLGAPVAFAPDGRRLAGLCGGIPSVWDAETGACLQTLNGHRGMVEALAFAPDGRTLATASHDTTVLIWATPDPPRPAAALSAAEAAIAWADLASGDAAVAYRAVVRLASDPARGVALLRERLAPAATVEAGWLAQRIAELDDGRYAIRAQASRELEALGERAAPALRRLLAGRPTPEARRQAEQLLARLSGPPTDRATLRALRAVEVLERIATPAAKQLLADLANGDPGARLTQEAAAALKRLGRRGKMAG